MAAIVVRRTVDSTGRASKKMVIATESGGQQFVVPFAPRDVEHGNRSRTWTPVERAGRTPILAGGGLPLATQKFKLTLAKPDRDESVEDYIAALEVLAQTTERLVIQYGAAEGGLWRMTSCEVTSMMRDVDANRTRAEVDIELIEASDYLARVGPVTGGAGGGGGGDGATQPGGSVRIYTVVAGDTLGKISQKFYKTPSKWRLIATANKIRNPKLSAKLKVGAKLRIPQLAAKKKKKK